MDDDDDDKKTSIWAHLGCRITVSDGSSFGHLKRPHLLGFVLFQSRVPGVSRRRLSLSTQPFLFLRLLEDLTGVAETNLAATTCAGPPPAAGGRNEPRRTAPSLPPRKIQEDAEEEDGGEKNGDREQKETSFVAAVAWSVKKQTRRSVLYNSTSSGCQTDAFRSCPPSRIPLSGGLTARASDVKRQTGSAGTRK